MQTILIVTILVVLSGLFSGLTLGLMSQNVFVLRRKAKAGNHNAKKILPLRERGNLLLCTLLLSNVAVNAALSIFLGSIAAGIIAGIIATSLIVVFGEIIPQAIFARYGLKYGSKFALFTWIFVIALYPITKPIAMIIDKIMGQEIPGALTKKEVSLILREQKNIHDSDIDSDDYEIVSNALKFSDRTVRSVMTPIGNTFLLNDNQLIDKNLLIKIRESGHSRIPVFHNKKKRVVGILFVKDLLTISLHKKNLVKEVMRKRVYTVRANKKLDDTLRFFQKKRIHLSVVRDRNKEIVGVVTLEDVLEEIFGEIIDEHDRYVDMRELTK